MGLKEAAQQAIEALKSARSVFNGEHDTCGGCAWCDAPSYGPCEPHCEKDRAVKALRAALAETTSQESRQVEPVGYGVFEDGNLHDSFRLKHEAKLFAALKGEHAEVGALYRSPPKREPLTESFLEELAEKHVTNCYFDTLTYAREIERLHSIGGEK